MNDGTYTGIDEEFLPFGEIVTQLVASTPGIRDEESGIEMSIYEIEVDTPIELNVFRNESGALQIGSIPPLYRVNTSFQPSYHQIKVRATLDD